MTRLRLTNQKQAILQSMSQAQKIQRLSIGAYFAMERDSAIRHEYLDGEIVAMGGASRTHNTLVFNLGAAIRPHLRGTPCRMGGSDMKVFIEAANRAYYPDLVVSCSNPADEPDEYTETQPILIVEVLSPSTARVDRTEKRINYQRLDSLQDYVLIAQREPMTTVYHRQVDSDWTQTDYRADDVIELASINVELPLSTLYEGIDR